MTPFGRGPEGPKIPQDSPKPEQGPERDDRDIARKIEGQPATEKSKFSRELREMKDAGFERGKNVHMTITFSRHDEPGKTPEGMSADFLTDKGINQAITRGYENPHKYIMVFGSAGVTRARETAAYELESAVRDRPTELAEAVNKKMPPIKNEARGTGFRKFASGEYIIYQHGDLDPVKGLKDVWLEGAKKASEAVERGEIPASEKENYQYDYYLNNPDRAHELKAQTPREAAQDMANRLSTHLMMSKRIYEGMDLNARNFSHGPKLDCALKFILRQPDGKLGFDKIEEIGGGFKPGESFDIDVERDENGKLKQPVRVMRGNREIGTLDLNAMKQLVREYYEKNKMDTSVLDKINTEG